MVTTCEDDGEARYGRTSNRKSTGMDGGHSRGASGGKVIRRVNENDSDATGMNPNSGTNQLATCDDRREEQQQEEREGGSRYDTYQYENNKNDQQGRAGMEANAGDNHEDKNLTTGKKGRTRSGQE